MRNEPGHLRTSRSKVGTPVAICAGMKKLLLRGPWLAALFFASACATLGQVVQPLGFATDERPAELRLLGPSAGSPLGGASVRLYARVRNPNPIGVTLVNLSGGLSLEGTQAARVNFPLGVPLAAGGESVVPLDIQINFSDVPRLASLLPRAVTGSPIAYQLDGRFGVDAGVLGQPMFGPMTLLRGSAQVRR